LIYFLKIIGNIEYTHIPDYAPTKELLEAYRKKIINWEEYEKKYFDILNQNILKTTDYSFFNDSCLLCSEEVPKYCHRRLLAEYLAGQNKQIKIVTIQIPLFSVKPANTGNDTLISATLESILRKINIH